jgi:hypothetical protein
MAAEAKIAVKLLISFIINLYINQATSKLSLDWDDEELNFKEVGACLDMWWKVVIYYTLR